MEQTSEAGQSVIAADRYAVLADEIRSLSQDVTDSLLMVLMELRKSNPNNVYVASKKFLDQNGFLLLDEGHLGIADRFILGENDEYLVCPGDVVIYTTPRKFKTDDVLLAFYFDKNSAFGLYHCRVLGFDTRGGVEIRDFDSKTYWIASERILGKLAKVIHFGDPEWHELIGQMVDEKFLVGRLAKYTKRQEEEKGPPDRSRRLDELNRRIAILTADQP